MGLYLYGKVEGNRCNPDSKTGMSPDVAEHFEEKIRSAIQHLRSITLRTTKQRVSRVVPYTIGNGLGVGTPFQLLDLCINRYRVRQDLDRMSIRESRSHIPRSPA